MARARPAADPRPATAPPETDRAPARCPLWAAAGLALFFLAAVTFGVLEVHYSTDTWIALAAGRQIVTSPQFPQRDTFSYTFAGQPWINQNWLSHVVLWLAYDRLGPDATVILHWLTGAALFTLVLLAVRLRSGSWVAGAVVGGLVALATRDWLRIRPATFQLLLLGLLWLASSALLSGGRPEAGAAGPRPSGGMSRWWPMVVLALVLGVWVHAHGSFLLGYGLLLVFLVTWGLARFFGDRTTLDGRQALALVGIGVLTAASGVVLSPFGLENLTHPFKVVESDIFREIGEWLPPTKPGGQPPVTRFWVLVAVAVVAPVVAALLRATGRRLPADGVPDARRGPTVEPRLPGGLHAGLFDVLSVGLGFASAMFARRFAPQFYILAGPALAALTLRLGRGAAPGIRAGLPRILGLAGYPAAALAAYLAFSWGRQELVREYHGRPGDTLLDRVTRNDESPRAALEFLHRNGLTANVLADWKVGGPIMFMAPSAKVFIDGRSQQLYTEDHVRRYLRLTRPAEQDAARALAEIEKSGTTAVLLNRWTSRLAQVLEPNRDWDEWVLAAREALSVPVGSPLAAEIERRERAGELWWPDEVEAHVARGQRWVQWGDRARAAECWQRAVALNPQVGADYYRLIIQNLVLTEHPDRAAEFYKAERRRLKQPLPGVTDAERAELLAVLHKAADALPGGFIDPFAPD